MTTKQPPQHLPILTWLRFHDVDCVRCKLACGEEGEDVYVCDDGCVCVGCVTADEKREARRA